MKIVKKIVKFLKNIFSVKTKKDTIDDMFFLILFKEEILNSFSDEKLLDSIDQEKLEMFAEHGTTLKFEKEYWFPSPVHIQPMSSTLNNKNK